MLQSHAKTIELKKTEIKNKKMFNQLLLSKKI